MRPDNKITLERMEFPEPVISVAVEPKTKADQEKMGKALSKLAQEDPSFRVHTDEETGQTIISGMGELHLEIIVDRMKREFSVEANVGKPQVAYRETIRKAVEKAEGKFVRQTGWSRSVRSRVAAPRAARSRAKATSSRTRSSAAAWCPRVHPGGDKGVQEQMQSGVSPASRWSTSRSRCTTALTTTSTRARWRSRSPVPWAFARKAPRRRAGELLEPIMASRW